MNKLREQNPCLKAAQAAVSRMWSDVAWATRGHLQMASPNDVVHFLHEEAGEVVKAAMALGLMGDKSYVRSDKTECTVYSYKDLIMEVGDVLLMALTLAQSFDLDPSVCLWTTLDKFYKRAEKYRYTSQEGIQKYVRGERQEPDLGVES